MIGCLLNPNNPNTEGDTKEAQRAARTLGLDLQILHARTDAEIEIAFANLAQKQVGGLVVVSDAFFNSRPEQIAALAARYAMPAIYSLNRALEACVLGCKGEPHRSGPTTPPRGHPVRVVRFRASSIFGACGGRGGGALAGEGYLERRRWLRVARDRSALSSRPFARPNPHGNIGA